MRTPLTLALLLAGIPAVLAQQPAQQPTPETAAWWAQTTALSIQKRRPDFAMRKPR